MDAFLMNDSDILPITWNDQDYDQFLKGFGAIDSAIKPQDLLITQNENVSPHKVLTQDNIWEPFQHSRGTLNSNDLPNQISAVNVQTTPTYNQNMYSSISNGQLTRIQADLEDQTVNSNTCTKTGDNMSDQEFEDVWNIIEHDQDGIVKVDASQDNQEVIYAAVYDAQIPAPVQAMTHDNIQKQNSNVFTTMNTVNQSGGIQVAVNISQPDFLTKQAALSTPSPIYQQNTGDKSKLLHLVNSKPATNFPVAEGYNPFQNNTVILNSNNLSNSIAAADPNVIHVTWQNDTDLTNQAPAPIQQTPASCTQNIGPIKIKSKRTGIVGRCPQGVLPLYLQPEPENEDDRKKWHRAKTAHGHRMNKKNALVNDANTIKDLMEEMQELKNQLNVVMAERDTYKNSLNALMNNVPRY